MFVNCVLQVAPPPPTGRNQSQDVSSETAESQSKQVMVDLLKHPAGGGEAEAAPREAAAQTRRWMCE